jgi:hypothetical protein
MRKTSFCVWIMFLLPALVFGGRGNSRPVQKQWTQAEIDKAWIMVPWTHGGHYYHNTLTRDDQDHPPTCPTGQCKWSRRR